MSVKFSKFLNEVIDIVQRTQTTILSMRVSVSNYRAFSREFVECCTEKIAFHHLAANFISCDLWFLT